MKTLGILGSTGSIGTQAIEVVKNLTIIKLIIYHVSLVHQRLYVKLRNLGQKKVCIVDSSYESEVSNALKDENIEVLSGYDGLNELSKQKVDLMLNSIVGADGMLPSILALENNIPLALANKEECSNGRLVNE